MHYERRDGASVSAEDYEIGLLGPLADKGHEATAQEAYSAAWRWYGLCLGAGPEPRADGAETVAEAGAAHHALVLRVRDRVLAELDRLGVREDVEGRCTGVSNAALGTHGRLTGHGVTARDVEAMHA